MGAPHTVRVQGLPYSVVFVEGEAWLDDTETHGNCHRTKLRIKIADDLPEPRKIETLLHEIGHAVYYENGVDHCNDEEAVVSAMMSGLFQVFMDNAWVLEALQNCRERVENTHGSETHLQSATPAEPRDQNGGRRRVRVTG